MNKIVLITGSTSGIGKASAYEFASKGYNIILCGRRITRLKALKSALESTYNIMTYVLNFDVQSETEVSESFDSLPDHWKAIDILINNAGLALGFDDFHEADIDHWNTMIDTNVKGLLYMTRAISPIMVAQQSGHIINVCSTAGHEVYPKGNVYCATKHAVDALTKAMRIDLHKHGIRVSQVSPGHVEETEFAKVRFEGNEQKAKIYEDFNPLKSSDVAEIIYFIASRPSHVNIQDVLAMGTQQAGSTIVNRIGRIHD